MYRNRNAPQSLIYVSDGNEVVIFPEKGANPPPVGTLTNGIHDAWGLYVDGRRNLYVANTNVGGAGTITEYAPGQMSPFLTYNDPSSPMYAVTDHTARVYASNHNGTVVEFKRGQTTPDRTLTTPGTEADGLDLDAAGNLYVSYRGSDGNGSIEKFAPNATQGRILGMAVVQPQGLVVDSAGNILVAETGSKFDVLLFHPGFKQPSSVLNVAPGITQIALRSAENWLYISNFINDDVYIGAYPFNTTRPKVYNDGLRYVQGLALSNGEHF